MNNEIFQFTHRNSICVGVKLPFQDKRITAVKKIAGITWSQTFKCWYVPLKISDAPENNGSEVRSLQQVKAQLEAALNYKQDEVTRNNVTPTVLTDPEFDKIVLNPEVVNSVNKLRQHLQVKRYSQNTIDNYMSAIHEFLKFFKDENWETLDEGDMMRFQQERVIDRKLSYSYQNTLLSAIKIFYKVNTGSEPPPGFIKRPRAAKNIPDIFNLQQIAQLIGSIKNQKHKMLISVGYGCGLRSGEVIKLKLSDIDAGRGMLFVRMGKGNKDRMIPISLNLITQLKAYHDCYKPKGWLFEGAVSGMPYSQRSLQAVFQRAVKDNKFDEKYRFHDLRHSYATHLMDGGTNLRIIQEILGHKNSKTTEIYTHVSKLSLQRIYNPFDHLDL